MNGEKGVIEPTFVKSPLYEGEGIEYFSSNVELGVSSSRAILASQSHKEEASYGTNYLYVMVFQCPAFFALAFQPDGVATIHPIGSITPEEQEYLNACLPE